MITYDNRLSFLLLSFHFFYIFYGKAPISTAQHSGWSDDPCSATPGPAHHALTDVAPLRDPLSVGHLGAAWQAYVYDP